MACLSKENSGMDGSQVLKSGDISSSLDQIVAENPYLKEIAGDDVLMVTTKCQGAVQTETDYGDEKPKLDATEVDGGGDEKPKLDANEGDDGDKKPKLDANKGDDGDEKPKLDATERDGGDDKKPKLDATAQTPKIDAMVTTEGGNDQNQIDGGSVQQPQIGDNRIVRRKGRKALAARREGHDLEVRYKDGKACYGLPEGWIVKEKPRKSLKYLGKVDQDDWFESLPNLQFYYVPETSKEFRSLKSALDYIEELNFLESLKAMKDPDEKQDPQPAQQQLPSDPNVLESSSEEVGRKRKQPLA